MFSFSLFFFNLLIYVPFWFLCFSWERQEQGWALIKSKVSACMSIWTHLTLQIPGQQESNLVLLPTLLRKRAENLRLEGKDFMFFNFPLCWRGKVFPTDRCQESQSLWHWVFSYGPLCSSLSSTATWNETLLMSSILGKTVVIVKLEEFQPSKHILSVCLSYRENWKTTKPSEEYVILISIADFDLSFVGGHHRVFDFFNCS